MTIIALLYQEGYKHFRVGYASAVSVIFFLVVLSISIMQRKFLHEDQEG